MLYTDNILDDPYEHDNNLANWLGSSNVFDRINYATAICLAESLNTIRLQRQFWKAYKDGYVWLFQKRLTPGAISKYNYIAVRTKKPYLVKSELVQLVQIH